MADTDSIDENNSSIVRSMGQSRTLRKIVPGLGKNEAGERAKDNELTSKLQRQNPKKFYDGSDNPDYDKEQASAPRGERAAARYKKIAAMEDYMDETAAGSIAPEYYTHTVHSGDVEQHPSLSAAKKYVADNDHDDAEDTVIHTVHPKTEKIISTHVRDGNKWKKNTANAGKHLEKDWYSLDTNLHETASADTLHPGAGSGGTQSRAEMTATFVQLLSQLGKEDLSHFLNDALAQIGKEADYIPSNANAAANMATIKAKPSAATASIKEDLVDLFADDDDLSEEFKEKATVVFEAALNTAAMLHQSKLDEEFEAKVAALDEEYATKLEEASTEIFEDVSEKLDQYLTYAIEQWMEANEIAIEKSIRGDIAEGFMSALQNLFTEHYVAVPEEKLDVLGEMKAEIEALKSKLNEAVDKNIQLESVIEEATKEALIDEVAEGLVVTQAEKLRTLSEGIEFTDADSFRRKLEIVKESVFKTGAKPAKSSGFITEEIDGSNEVSEQAVPAHMQKYVQAISKSLK
jgi:hypothetical protein